MSLQLTPCLTSMRQVLDKLQRSLDAGQHYEAEQMLKTVYYRYRARKQLDEAYQLLQVLCRPLVDLTSCLWVTYSKAIRSNLATLRCHQQWFCTLLTHASCSLMHAVRALFLAVLTIWHLRQRQPDLS